MANTNRQITLGQLKGPGGFVSSTSRRFLCGEQSCPGGGVKARPDEIQRHVVKDHGHLVNYANIRVQETDPNTQVTTTITAAQYVDRIWAAAGLPVPPARRTRTSAANNAHLPASASVATISPAINNSLINNSTAATTTNGPPSNTLAKKGATDPRLGMFKTLVQMTTQLSSWLISEGINQEELQAWADNIVDEADEEVSEDTDEDTDEDDE